MYRQGTATSKIAAAAGAAETTVRYHLAVAANQDPGLRAAHKAALPKTSRVSDAGRRNLAEILAFYRAEGRPPIPGRLPRESTLAGWLHSQAGAAGRRNRRPSLCLSFGRRHCGVAELPDQT